MDAKQEVLIGKLAIDGGSPVRSKMLVFGEPVLDEAEFDEVLDTPVAIKMFFELS